MKFTRGDAVRAGKFGVVGALGVGVNFGCYTALYALLGVEDFLARAVAIEIAILHNFTWNFTWTWADRGRSWRRMPGALLRYHGSTLFASYIVTLGIGWLVLRTLHGVPLAEYISHLVGIGAGMLVNYLLSDRWVFRPRDKEESPEEV